VSSISISIGEVLSSQPDLQVTDRRDLQVMLKCDLSVVTVSCDMLHFSVNKQIAPFSEWQSTREVNFGLAEISLRTAVCNVYA
jgi:hypothetical protein